MITQEFMSVVSQKQIAKNIFELVLKGELVQYMEQPGQFVHIRPHSSLDPLLRRPISIARIDKNNNQFTVIYRAEGKGTKILSDYKADDIVDVLGPLGNGFPVNDIKEEKTALLIGGGIGVPPLYELTRKLHERKVQTVHVLGFQSKDDVFYENEFSEWGKTYIATADGSYGYKGFVTDIIDQFHLNSDLVFACGPMGMLKALKKKFPNQKGYFSLEERMGCGIGACFACVCHVKEPMKGKDYVKICSDGPVFPIGKVVLS